MAEAIETKAHRHSNLRNMLQNVQANSEGQEGIGWQPNAFLWTFSWLSGTLSYFMAFLSG